MKTCPICNQEFEPINGMQKYCSGNCYRVSKNNTRNKHDRTELINIPDRICEVCGEEFEVTPKSIKKKYCSEQCRRKAERIYGNKQQIDLDYKNEIRFDGNKYKVLERDNYECQICGNKQQLVVHHKDCSGQSDEPNNDIDNLITLCRKCHINIHRTGIV